MRYALMSLCAPPAPHRPFRYPVCPFLPAVSRRLPFYLEVDDDLTIHEGVRVRRGDRLHGSVPHQRVADRAYPVDESSGTCPVAPRAGAPSASGRRGAAGNPAHFGTAGESGLTRPSYRQQDLTRRAGSSSAWEIFAAVGSAPSPGESRSGRGSPRALPCLAFTNTFAKGACALHPHRSTGRTAPHGSRSSPSDPAELPSRSVHVFR
jgi:hypothetical protein